MVDQKMAAGKERIRLSPANPDWKILNDEWFEISPFGRDDKRGNVEMTKKAPVEVTKNGNGRDERSRSLTVQQVQGNPPSRDTKWKPDFDFAIKMTMTGHFRKGGRPDKKPHSGTCSTRPD
jgi:hypothetical protein